jgi:hypothetical protein
LEHSYAYRLLLTYPGTVLLDDVPIAQCNNEAGPEPQTSDRLYRTHGLAAVSTIAREGVHAAVARFPDLDEVLSAAEGILVTSRRTAEMISRLYGPEAGEAAGMLGPSTGSVVDRATARERLGVGLQDFVVCSFGDLTVIS